MCRMFTVHSFFDEKTQTKLLNSLQNYFQVYLLIKKGRLGFQNGVKIAEILFIYDNILYTHRANHFDVNICVFSRDLHHNVYARISTKR